MVDRAREVRASELLAGDVFIDEDERTMIASIAWHGDTVLVSGTAGETPTFDRDDTVTVVQRASDMVPIGDVVHYTTLVGDTYRAFRGTVAGYDMGRSKYRIRRDGTAGLEDWAFTGHVDAEVDMRFGEPVLGGRAPSFTGEIVIAWGYVNAHVDGVDYDRFLILSLIDDERRVPGVANYSVAYVYPADLPPNTRRFEARETFANIGPAVEAYAAWGMDW